MSNELQRTSGRAAELKASGAEIETAICCSFPIRYISKHGFNFLSFFLVLSRNIHSLVGAS